MSDERRYYPIVRDWLEDLLKQRFGFCHLEITANKNFSNDIKAHILQGREIIFHFLRQTAPDITGFVDRSRGSGFVVADVKTRTITLEDVYQVKRYAELFSASWGLLLSTKEIPEEFKRLHSIAAVTFSTLTGHGQITLGWLRGQDREWIPEWFPGDPFAKSLGHRILFG